MFNSKINSSSINGLSAVLRDLCARMFSRQMIGDQHNIRCYTRDDRVSLLFQAVLVRRGCNKKRTRQTSNIFFLYFNENSLVYEVVKRVHWRGDSQHIIQIGVGEMECHATSRNALTRQLVSVFRWHAVWQIAGHESPAQLRMSQSATLLKAHRTLIDLVSDGWKSAPIVSRAIPTRMCCE